jgi:hypothetical protein
VTTSSKQQALRPPGEQGAAGFLLTPSAQAALLGFGMLQANLRIWRSVADSMRESFRSQQDAMLRMVLDRTTQTADVGGEAAQASNGAEAANGASDFLMPVRAAQRAYVQMSGAMIEAQREALSALMRDTRPH